MVLPVHIYIYHATKTGQIAKIIEKTTHRIIPHDTTYRMTSHTNSTRANTLTLCHTQDDVYYKRTKA